ncbi:transposase [Clostridium aestuarii]|uniref:Transposase n=1 Tax=Clostridium aestuarii TaxID=338193 RepID=A0ABT4D276_9CLOT|nr:transposase [Clostridium aestuarii]MCY6485334.1 transposase [Clostridium aestuarii]
MGNYTIMLTFKTEKWQEDIINKRLEIGRKIYNACLNELFKRYRTMEQSKVYRKEWKNLREINKDIDNCKKDDKKKVKLEKKKLLINKDLRDIKKKFKLYTPKSSKFKEALLRSVYVPMQHYFKKHIQQEITDKIADRAVETFYKYMYDGYGKPQFKKFGEFNSIENRRNSCGIIFKGNIIKWGKLKIPIVCRKNDIYVQTALGKDKVKYSRIVRKFVRGKYKYYVQLILEGVPPSKLNKDTISKGSVGIDIGTQTIAICSKKVVKLLELSPEIQNIDKERKRLLMKLKRSRRATNASKYNKDGTLNENNKDNWIKSNHYIKTQLQLREMYRRQADIRRQSHNKLAKYILSLGDTVYVETMNYKALQRKAKKTIINKKTGKCNRRKRFGKSIGNKAPSMLLDILDNKLKYQNKELIKINTWKVKASQYNHINQKCVKKAINERWKVLNYKGKEIKIQRDLYSAFLIMNVNDDLESVNNELCDKLFDDFIIFHDQEIERIRISNNKRISSMGI